jgi:hypothetical protein
LDIRMIRIMALTLVGETKPRSTSHQRDRDRRGQKSTKHTMILTTRG